MASSPNPWITRDEEPVEMVPASGSEPPYTVPASTGLVAPLAGHVVPPPAEHRLPRRHVDLVGKGGVWWVGVHGGAGESTLAGLRPGSHAAGHAWPIRNDEAVREAVVLVARTTARGLLAVQAACREWSAGSVAVDVVGLVLIADAPGKLPRPLRDLARVVAGGAPRVWNLPWNECLRTGAVLQLDDAPKPVRRLTADLDVLLNERQS